MCVPVYDELTIIVSARNQSKPTRIRTYRTNDIYFMIHFTANQQIPINISCIYNMLTGVQGTYLNLLTRQPKSIETPPDC